MKKIDAYQLMNGEIFTSYNEAKQRAENLYGLALSKLAHELVKIEKYQTMIDVLDSNTVIEDLLKLKALKDDYINLTDQYED